MSFETLLAQAARLGIPADRQQSSSALARRLQSRLGEEPCSGTDKRYGCRREDCRWRRYCQRLVAAWQR